MQHCSPSPLHPLKATLPTFNFSFKSTTPALQYAMVLCCGGGGSSRVSPLNTSSDELYSPASELVYVLGGAGVGKSTWIQSNLQQTHKVLDPDSLMAMCPLEDPDPNGKDSVTYHWTKRRIDELMAEALENPGRYAIPGTGGTTGKDGEKSKKVQYLRRAKDAGFVTRVVLLTCSDDVALKRNARRPRQLPEEIVKSSIEAAAAAFEVLSKQCDMAQQIDVSAHKSGLRGRRMSLTVRRSSVTNVNIAKSTIRESFENARSSQRSASWDDDYDDDDDDDDVGVVDGRILMHADPVPSRRTSAKELNANNEQSER